MAVVTPEWKYIHWYYGGDGMMPTEELFHLGRDRLEMSNVIEDPRHAAVLAAMRNAYDVELAAIKSRVVRGHGYEPYPVLFDRSISWRDKEAVHKTLKPVSGSEGEAPAAKKNRKKTVR
jgi:hypothetical protein